MIFQLYKYYKRFSSDFEEASTIIAIFKESVYYQLSYHNPGYLHLNFIRILSNYDLKLQ